MLRNQRYCKSQEVPKNDLDDLKFIYECKRIIRKHAYLHRFYFVRKPEAKVLIDLDALDAFSDERIRIYKAKYIKVATQKNLRMIKLAVWYFERIHGQDGHFEWTQSEIIRRRKNLLEEGYRFIETYQKALASMPTESE